MVNVELVDYENINLKTSDDDEPIATISKGHIKVKIETLNGYIFKKISDKSVTIEKVE